jgi:hypothetical protein
MLSAGLFITSASAKTKRKSAPRTKSRSHVTKKSATNNEASAKKTEKVNPTAAKPIKPKSGLCKGDSVDCWNALAINYAKQGRLEEARQAMEAAFRTDPRLSALRGNLEAVYASLAGNAYDSALGLTSGRKPVDLAMLPAWTEPHRRVAPTDMVAVAPPVKAKAEPKAQLRAVIDTSAKVASAEPLVLVKPVALRDTVKSVVLRDTTKSIAKLDTLKVAVAAAKVVKPKPLRDTTKVRPKIDSAKIAVSKPVQLVRKDTLAASKAKTKTKPEDPKEIRQQVSDALERWAKAWSDKNVEGYLELYSPAFMPANGMDRQKWEAFRRERLLAPASIEVKLESLKVEPGEDGRQAASFLQTYKTEAVKLRSRKHLVLERIGKIWMIVAEGEAK